jgi:hypothetical protein
VTLLTRVYISDSDREIFGTVSTMQRTGSKVPAWRGLRTKRSISQALVVYL